MASNGIGCLFPFSVSGMKVLENGFTQLIPFSLIERLMTDLTVEKFRLIDATEIPLFNSLSLTVAASDELYLSMGLSPKYLITVFMLRVAPRTNT